MIGIIGAGQIVTAAHLPAYQKLGLPVKAIYDINQSLAGKVALHWNMEAIASPEELISRTDIQIVDIAVPPAVQVPVLEAALRAGKHVLAQKPLAPTLEEAARLVAIAEREGRFLVVNQQMRWSPVVQTIKAACNDGRLGSLRELIFHIEFPLPPEQHLGWLSNEPRFTVLFNTIHFLDTARFLLGDPSSLIAVMLNRDPHLVVNGEVGTQVILEFPQNKQAIIYDNRNAFGDHLTTFRAIGANGALRGKFGLWTNYPEGEDDVIEYTSLGAPQGWESIQVEGNWIPDAFVGPIGELVDAIRYGRKPTVSGQEHLKTLRLVEAVYDSATAGARIYF